MTPIKAEARRSPHETTPQRPSAGFSVLRTCSRCGAVRPEPPRWERTFRCDACGLVLDRDENAARNLAALVATVAGRGPETEHACGRDGRPALVPAVPEEAGSRRRMTRRRPAPPPGNGRVSGTDFSVLGNGDRE